ncbi:oligopeptide/dipeptide ABC transporter ATP-binding protein [Goodfellowiella coeruleoviolacea]|uniref:Oligopeptide/dipeptide ABC transporter, ATP-binding protein, C-terminal domain-containing protein n=1 Tax=Goodfellowiella coeruleoviolacea TaxID=334858 RepID=A0AAE3GC25_9PSEU|nr:ABC transporter ATP-binding protein [Goodfellowiella coeruleoviolacea]MCP2163408.1 oligopeptide/dipeptide ABC transporter, ATP-binding protein, C-terminal domain-containing protein [Goodfellowiella coeruleoviolacea]
MSEHLLELDGVHVVHRVRSSSLFGRDEVHALTDANLVLTPGQTVGVVGESGCGKSTLAKVVVGLQRPTSGTVRYRGTSLWAMGAGQRAREFGRDVGMVFQDPSTALNRRLPVARIIRDPLDVHRVGTPAERADRVRELMSLVGLPSSAEQAVPSQLSGGQRQRVAIARALALRPGLLVADEPTSALDVSVRAQILNLLMDLRDRLNLAMVFVSHDIQTVRKMSDRIVTMYLGRIVEEAPASALPDQAHHPYTRALFSATPSLLHAVEPIVLTGPVPSATAPPSGCGFRTRCWKATDDCARALPPLASAGESAQHTYRCIHPELPTEVSAP